MRRVDQGFARRMALYFMSLLLGATVLGGCASAWMTLTPSLPAEVPTPRASPRGPYALTPMPAYPIIAPSPQPTATLGLMPLNLTGASVQSWSDPNDITGLLNEGTFLWAATSGGVVRWDRATGEHRLFTVSDGLASQAIRGIAQDGDGHIWVGYADQVSWSEYDGERWHNYTSREKAVESRYHAMLKARRFDPRLWTSRPESAWLWLPAGDGRAKAYDGDRWRAYGTYEGVTRDTWLMAVSEGGRVWAIGQGISTAEEGERWWVDHTLFSGVPEASRVADVAPEGDDGLWLAFVGPSPLAGGVARLNLTSNLWTGYRHSLNPAIPVQVHGVEIDDEGVVWLYGDGGVAHHPPKGRWRALPLEGLSVQSLARDDEGNLWLGTDRGIWSRRADDSAEGDGYDLTGPWLVSSPILGNDVTRVALDGGGTLWIGTPKGVSYVRPSGGTGILTTEEPFCLVVNPAGLAWVGLRTGLYALQSDGTRERLLDVRVRLVTFDESGAAWAYTEDGQLGVLNGSSWRIVADVAALIGSPPRAMVVSSGGTVWLGTEAGLGILQPNGEFSLATEEDRLLSRDVRSLALGPDDTVWIATARGLARRTPSDRWTRFTTESTEGGLRSMDMWAVHVDEEGTLWMATSAGISVRTPEADWFYFDLPGARTVHPSPSEAIWVGTRGGLYRLTRDVLTLLP